MNARAHLPAVAGFAVFAVVGMLMPHVAGTYLIGVGLTLCMWIALAQSWVVVSGMTGYISLGHAVFVGLGAYVMALVWQSLDLWLAVPLAGLTAAAAALAVGYPCFRVRGPYFVILTFGVAEFVKFIVVAIEAELGQTGRLLFGTPALEDLFYVMFGFAFAATLVTYVVKRTRFGTGLSSIREDEDAAETVGVPVARFKLFAYALSAFVPGMVGAVLVLRSTYFEPLQVFNPITSFTIVSMAIIGGSDDAPGPILGALFLVLLSEMLWANLPQVYMILLGALLIGFVLFAPDGLAGWLAARAGRRRGAAA